MTSLLDAPARARPKPVRQKKKRALPCSCLYLIDGQHAENCPSMQSEPRFMGMSAARAKASRDQGPLCGICHEREATEAHHCLIPTLKRFKKYLDHYVNLEMVCSICHQLGLGDTLDHRRAFYIKQTNRYGLAVQEWIDALPYKLTLTHRIDFLS